MRSRVHEAEPKSLYAIQDLQTFRGLTLPAGSVDISGSINVPFMGFSTLRTSPVTNIRRHFLHGEAAATTASGRREKLVDCDHAAPRPFAFVL